MPRKLPLLLCALPLGLGLGLAPAPADAAVYCVHHENTACAAGSIDMKDDVHAAIEAADASAAADVVRLNAGTYVVPPAGLKADSEDLAIAAPDGAFLTGPASTLLDAGSAQVSGLVFQPQGAATSLRLGLGGSAKNIEVKGSAAGQTGIVLAGATVSDAKVALHGASTVGVVAVEGATGSALQRSSVYARTGVRVADEGNLTVRRGWINSVSIAADVQSGRFTTDATVMNVGDAGDTAVRVHCAPGVTTIVKLTSTTVRALAGKAIASTCKAQASTVEVRRSIVTGPMAITRLVDSPTTFDIDQTIHHGKVESPNGLGVVLLGNHAYATDPKLVGGADLRPAPGSPAIDRVAAPAGGAFDLDGNVRPIDGDGDGVALADFGAYEVLPPVKAAPGGAEIGPVPDTTTGATDTATTGTGTTEAATGATDLTPTGTTGTTGDSTPRSAPTQADLAAALRLTLRSGTATRRGGRYVHGFAAAGSVRIEWRAGRVVVARGRVTRTSAGKATVRVRPTARGRALLRGGGRLRLQVRGVATAEGARATASLRRTLR
jgi:hypothetical protein